MIIADDPKIIKNIEEFRNYIEKELNVKTINFTNNKSRYVKLRAEPDHKTLGSRLKSDFKRVTAAIRVRWPNLSLIKYTNIVMYIEKFKI